MKNLNVFVFAVSFLIVGCSSAELRRLAAENQAMQARLDTYQAEQHQSGYPDMRQSAEAERIAQIAQQDALQDAQNVPIGGAQGVAGQPPQMGARIAPSGGAGFAPTMQVQPLIVPNPRPITVTAGVLGGPQDHDIEDGRYYHFRVALGPGVGVVFTTNGGINVPIDGGAYAMLDTNGRRVFVVPGAEDGQHTQQRDVWFGIVRGGSLTARCIRQPAPEVLAAGMPPVSNTVGTSRTVPVDAYHTFSGMRCD